MHPPPHVLVHGASSNLEVMRQPLGDLLARKNRVILIDRPGHGCSIRTKKAQALMMSRRCELGIARVILVVHWARRARPAIS